MVSAVIETAQRFIGARGTGIEQHDRARWLQARRQGLGGSEVAAILGIHPYKSALEVYADKVGVMPPETNLPEVALWGSIFEQPILREYERRSRRIVIGSNELHVSRERAWHLCTPDGIEYDGDIGDGTEPGITEIKTTGYGKWEEQIPAHVLVQVQHGMAVTLARWGTLVWLPFPERRLQWKDLTPHAEFQAYLAEHVDAFWTRVVTRSPPDADGSDSARAALFALEPELVDETVALDEGAEDIADELEQLSRHAEFIEERKRLISNRVLQTLGPYKVGLLPSGRYWSSWRTEERQSACTGCGKVHTTVGGFRACRLLQARKKPHALPRERRVLSLESTEPELAQLLAASLEQRRNDR